MSEITRHRPDELKRSEDLDRPVSTDVFKGWYGGVGGAVGIICTILAFTFPPGFVQVIFFCLAVLSLIICLYAALVRERAARKREWQCQEAAIGDRDKYIDSLVLPIFSIEIGKQDFQKRKTQQHLPSGEVREVTVIDGAVHLTIRNNGAETSIHNWRGYLFYDGGGLESSVRVSRESDMSRYSVDEIGRNKTIQVAVHIMSGPIDDRVPDGAVTGWLIQFQDVLNRMPKCWQPPSKEPPFDHIDPDTNLPESGQ